MPKKSSRLFVIGTATALATVIAIVVVVWIVFGISNAHEAYAPPTTCHNCGASELAPGEDPTAPGWDPNGASADAPGQEAEIPPQPCDNCDTAKDFSPGQEGLKEGIIGSDKKIIPG